MSRFVLGVDEAGYGPNLGPLVIAATAWKVDSPVSEEAFFDLLACVLRDDESTGYRGLKIGDSKQVYQSGKGLKDLERSVLTLLGGLGVHPSSLKELLGCLGINVEAVCLEEPWYFEHDVPLPVATTREDLDQTLHSCLSFDAWQEIGLQGIRLQFVTPALFNRHLKGDINKAVILSTQSVSLVHQLLNTLDYEPTSTKILMDRHGGRKTYADLLTEEFGEFTFLLEESPRLSRYRLGQREFEFHVQGERYLPVAVASMVAKYIRELSMLSFNRYWQSRLEGLKPTAGYPGDAKRYFEEIQPIMRKQKVKKELIWRER
jgi:ribonuclease HII